MTASSPLSVDDGDSSPRLNMLAILLLLFSLVLLSYSMADNTKRELHEPAKASQTGHQKERALQVVVLPEQKNAPSANPSKGAHQTQAGNPAAKGHMPAIDASFSMPVQTYLRILEARVGARLVLFDSRHRRILGSLAGGHFTTAAINIRGMSMRARDITSDLNRSLRQSLLAEAGNPGDPVKFLIMLPESAEQRFEHTLASFISSLGFDWQNTGSISLEYMQSDGNIDAKINSVNVQGKTHRIGKSIRIW